MSILISDFPAWVALGATQADFDRWALELKRRNSGNFPVRFTVEVGAYRTVGDLIVAAEVSGIRFTDWARGWLSEVRISDPGVLKIVTPTLKELGFTDELTFLRDVHARGIELGYELVPSDFPLSLSLSLSLNPLYQDQLMNETVLMAMRALRRPGGNMGLFYVRRDSVGRFVGGCYGSPEVRFRLDARFAFADLQV